METLLEYDVFNRFSLFSAPIASPLALPYRGRKPSHISKSDRKIQCSQPYRARRVEISTSNHSKTRKPATPSLCLPLPMLEILSLIRSFLFPADRMRRISRQSVGTLAEARPTRWNLRLMMRLYFTEVLPSLLHSTHFKPRAVPPVRIIGNRDYPT